nr:hypothetical protein [Providencia rettgeri]
MKDISRLSEHQLFKLGLQKPLIAGLQETRGRAWWGKWLNHLYKQSDSDFSYENIAKFIKALDHLVVYYSLRRAYYISSAVPIARRFN